MLFQNRAQDEGTKLYLAESSFFTFLENKAIYASPEKLLILLDTLKR